MKTTIRTLAAVTVLAASSAANAEFSANIGFMSEYYYRGIFQESTSANGGLDYEKNGFYVGTWAADVGDGLEVDGYFGYGTSVGDIDLSIGYTGYFYTGDFDDTYQEINLGGAFGPLSLDVAVGEYDNFDGPTLDYTYYALTLASESGLYGTYAGFAQDFDGEYVEFGYGTTVAEIDVGVAVIFANDDLVGDEEESIVFTIAKSFDL